MKDLLLKAQKSAGDAEIYSLDQTFDTFRFENGSLKNISSSMLSGVSLRLIKEGHLGFAYTRRSGDHDRLIQNALASLREGVAADFAFPKTLRVKELSTFDPALETISGNEIAAECERVIGFLNKLTNGQLNASAHRQTTSIRVMSSAGTDVKSRSSIFFINVDLMFPGTYAAISHPVVGKSFARFNDATLEWLAGIFKASVPEVTPSGGRMEIMFMPEAMYALLWRLKSATNGRSIYKKESPIINQLGKQLFDKKFSAYDDPLDDLYPGARPFDDEGTACRKLEIVEKGCIKNFYYDLNYAAKMETVSTGHGYRSAAWGSDPIACRPAPCLNHFFIKAGDKSFEQLVSAMKRGIIVFNCLGAHSGNIPNGDFSIGLAPGLYVENGEIRGRVKNAMVSGNIYDLMKNIIGMENAVHMADEGCVPAILFESAMVAVQ